MASFISVFFRAFTDGIREAGKKPGNNTIMDGLYLAPKTLEKASEEGKSLAEAIQKAYNAAREGVEHTKGMEAHHGRVAYYQEKSIWVTDAGATMGALILEGFYQ